LLQSPEASLNASTSPSIASTVPMASPSIRRSARIQDSPSISYRDSLRSSVMRDTCTPVRQLGRRRSRSRSRSRIFGLDASDRSRLDKNSDSEVEEEGGKDSTTVNPYKQILITKVIPVLTSPKGKGVAASLLLLFMLVFTQWVVGQGMTSIVSWVMGPLSGLRMAIMSLPDIVMGSLGGKVEINEVELVVKLMDSDKMREVIERLAEERMWEMERESDKRLRNEVERMNNEIENMRRMFLDTEIKRLAVREEELKSDKAVQTGEGGDEVVDVGHDALQKLELVEIQVEQMKFSLEDFSKQLRDRRDLSELEEEVKTIKGVVENINKERNGVGDLDHRLGLVQQRVNHLSEGRDEVSKLEKEVETIKQEMKKEGGQSSTMEMVKEVLSDMLADPLSSVYEKAVVEMGKETDRLEDMVMELKETVNQTEPKLDKTLTVKVDMMKINLMEELVQLTETLHSNWSRVHIDTTVSLPQVSALLDTQLSQYSADRTGQVDWASLALGGVVISTPNTTTHPAPGQGLSLLGFPLWQLSSSPTLILQQQSGDNQCWAFSGQAGQVVLQLAKVVRVTGVTIEHVRPSPDLSNAPRNIVVWDHEDNTHLMNLTYSISTASSSVQTFPLPSSTSISKLRLEITSNWGHPEHTCLYRVRVHGVQEEVEDKKTAIEVDSSVELM